MVLVLILHEESCLVIYFRFLFAYLLRFGLENYNTTILLYLFKKSSC